MAAETRIYTASSEIDGIRSDPGEPCLATIKTVLKVGSRIESADQCPSDVLSGMAPFS